MSHNESIHNEYFNNKPYLGLDLIDFRSSLLTKYNLIHNGQEILCLKLPACECQYQSQDSTFTRTIVPFVLRKFCLPDVLLQQLISWTHLKCNYLATN